MNRRDFLARTGSLVLSVSVSSGSVHAAAAERAGMGTVIFRNRFAQTRPTTATIENPLTLLSVPQYYQQRFGIRQLEFWSKHFDSLEKPYLLEVRDRVKAAGAELVNVQVDEAYDLASTHEEERQRSLATVRQWIDAAALLGSKAVRINPGKAGGSLEKSIVSMKVVNAYCRSKRLPLLTENHFGLEKASTWWSSGAAASRSSMLGR